MILSGGLIAAAPAQAAEGAPAITEVAFDSSTVQNRQTTWINAKWEIPAKAVAPARIVLPLPAELQGNTDSFPMMNGQDPIGTCVVTKTEVVCSVDDTFISENSFKVKGGIRFEVTVNVAEGTTGDKNFEFGNLSATVSIQPSGGSCTENCGLAEIKHSKWGYYNKETDTILWTVQVAAPATGIAAGQKIRIWDSLDLATFTPIGKPVLYSAKSVHRDAGNGTMTGNFAHDSDSVVTYSDDGLELSFTSLPGLGSDYHGTEQEEVGLDGRFYQVLWTVKVNDLGKAGTYTNEAGYEIAGEPTTGIIGEAKRQSGSAWGIGTNFGAFELTKKIDPSSTDQIAAIPQFQVRYSAIDAEGIATSDTFAVQADGSFESPEFIDGTTVTIEEILPNATNAIIWQAPVFDVQQGPGVSFVDGKLTLKFTKENNNLGKQTQIVLTNSAELQTGSFAASKRIVNSDGLVISPETTFSLNYSYPANTELGFIAGSGTLELPSNGDVVVSGKIPVGAELAFTEEINDGAKTLGGTWQENKTVLPEALTITGSPDPISVELVNTIERSMGGFTVAKNLSGSGIGHIGAGEEFTVNYSYPADATLGFKSGSGSVQVRSGAPATVTGIPFGANVTLTEDAVDRQGIDHQSSFSLNNFTIDSDEPVEVLLTNTYELQHGSIAVRKQLAGTGAGLVSKDASFTVDYSYLAGIGFEGGDGTLTVPADGNTIAIDGLPFGAVVTLSERTPMPVPGASWAEPVFTAGGKDSESSMTVTIDGKGAVEVSLTNTITADPSPKATDPKETPAPGAALGLAATGAATTSALVGGGIAMLLGALVLAAGRIRRHV
ncbi:MULTISPECIES: DUF5979 domain-containing protein [unclassified Leucobacter]|uniref:DUF5979 domain-containing protein n=1 Tax=unclassified Leucobacter TaxID=2621730 RepID=UPI00165E7464|nr:MULTISPECIES: DUF5979 domain-containing protein [unclassified Leucobacter]MBC9937634.1 hypothetical protein [Leucobacter sp. cx-87]